MYGKTQKKRQCGLYSGLSYSPGSNYSRLSIADINATLLACRPPSNPVSRNKLHIIKPLKDTYDMLPKSIFCDFRTRDSTPECNHIGVIVFPCHFCRV